MHDINSLLNEALEIEGLLRVLMARDDGQVRALLQQKVQSLSDAVNAECGMQDAECGMQDAECGMQDTESGMHDAECVDSPEGDRQPEEQISIDSDFSVDIVEFEPEVKADTQPRIAPEPEAVGPAPASKSFITFNEKYRFARELFNNQHALMSEVVAKVTSMHSLPEAYDYVINDLKLDEDNPVVIEFLEVIARYFNSRT